MNKTIAFVLLLLSAPVRAEIMSLGDFSVNGSAITPATVVADTVTATGAGFSIQATNGNVYAKYGVNASTAVITYVQASSITTTGGLNAWGNSGFGTLAPATKLHMSSGTLTVDGTAATVKVGDATNAGTLTVAGTSGSSTFYGSTMTVSATGIVSAPSQPRAVLRLSTNKLFTGEKNVFWTNVDKSVNTHFDAVNSSDTVTIAAGAGGAYDLACSLTFSAGVTTDAIASSIWVNGGRVATGYGNNVASQNITMNAIRLGYELAAGDAVVCKAYASPAGGVTVEGASYHAYFTVKKN